MVSLFSLSALAFAAPSITSLSPASGAVGASVTITGTNFGATQGTSTVKFNGTTATATSWSASSIVAKVPSGATSGNLVITVSGAASNGKSFTVLSAPAVSSLSPTSGAVGISVTIAGSNFGASQGTSTVAFNGIVASITTWGASSIVAKVPSGATTGNLIVHASGVDSNGVSFVVLPTPSIASLSPTSGMIGDSVTITGTNFGASQGTSTVKFNGTAATPTSWSNTGIVVPVPAGASTGNVVVTVSGVASAGVSFTAFVTPGITSLSPSSGAVGAAVTITGTNFQSTQGSSTVAFNGTVATPTSWTATQVKTVVPSGATTGSVAITVAGLVSNGKNFTVLPTPSITGLSPTVGAVGMRVTISGANFGATQGSSTVKFNGIAATPASWSATQITVPVPSGAATGNIVVHASGVDTNGANFAVATVLSITVAPQSLAVPLNSAQRFIAMGTYSNGATQSLGNNAIWASSNTSVGTIDANGLLTAVSQGQTTIQASFGAVNGSSSLNVTGPSFTRVGDLLIARVGHTATLLQDGRVLIVGGLSDTSSLASAEIYDPVTRSFSFAGGLRTAREHHTATLLQDGRVLIAGGSYYDTNFGDFPGLASAEIYDPVAGSFTPTGPLTAMHINHTAMLLPSGKVLILGGDTGDESPEELYDPVTGTFSVIGTCLINCSKPVTLLSNGTVLLTGGQGVIGGMRGALTDAEIFDPATAAYVVTGSLNTPTIGHTATLLKDGRVLVVGGTSNVFNFIPTIFAAEIYDPITQVFAYNGALSVPRLSHTATLLNNGNVLIVGGQDSSGTILGAELFDLSSQTFVGAGSPDVPHSSHTAILLNDGTVLVVGGYEQNGKTKRAALYGPPPPAPASLHITPATASMKLGGTRQLTLIDDLGHTRYEATWTVSDPSIATLSTDSLPILTGLAYGQVSVTATIDGVSAQAQISVGPSSLQITPAVVTMQAGDTRQFTVVDDAGNPTSLATWTLSDSSLATITTDASPMLTAIAPGQINLTASLGSISGQAQITILPAGQLAPGTVLWSVPSTPGFSALQLAQAVPTDSGPDLYSTQLSNDGTHTTIQALSSDGQQTWQVSLPRINGNSVPDSLGGLIVTENNTCLPGQQDPMAIVDLDAKTGQRLWQITAQPSGTLYCFPEAPQMAIRGDGSVVIATPGNTSGLPELMLVDGTYGFQTQIPIPPSTYTNPDGTTFQGYSRIGSPIVNSDGSAYVEYEVRQIAYPPTVTSSTLYLLQIAPDNSTSTTQLSSTTSDTNLLPARIIPDGQGGVVATWAISPSNPPVPVHPYQAAHVVAGAVATTYDLPFSPTTVTYGKYPTLVLGENGTAFATDEIQIVSFDPSSGSVNWSYLAAVAQRLSIIAATLDNGLVAKTVDASSDEAAIRFDSTGNMTADSFASTIASNPNVLTSVSAARNLGANRSLSGLGMLANISYYSNGLWLGSTVNGLAGIAGNFMWAALNPFSYVAGDAAGQNSRLPLFETFEPVDPGPPDILASDFETRYKSTIPLATRTRGRFWVGSRATSREFMTQISKPVDAIAFVGHSFSSLGRAIGLCFGFDCIERTPVPGEPEYPDGAHAPGYTISLVPRSLPTQARIIFFSACDLDASMQTFMGITTSTKGRALLVPQSPVDVHLYMGEYAWTQIAMRLAQANNLQDAVQLANDAIDHKLFVDAKGNPVPKVHWKVVGDGNIHFY